LFHCVFKWLFSTFLYNNHNDHFEINVHTAVLQSYFSNNRLDFYETTPSVPVVITPTVPISCPPCSVTLTVTDLRGLTVSTCQVTFYTYESMMTSRTISIRAVPTAGSNSRTTELQFLPTSTEVAGTGWDSYTVPTIPVRVYRPVN